MLRRAQGPPKLDGRNSPTVNDILRAGDGGISPSTDACNEARTLLLSGKATIPEPIAMANIAVSRSLFRVILNTFSKRVADTPPACARPLASYPQ